MADYGMSATYSPEDNKLRLYSLARLSDEEYSDIKTHGFRWAPKQELFVAPRWTPQREDVLLDLCGEVEDEDQSPEDRAADRADRFGGYRDKRRAEAHGHANAFDAGPAVHGYQNQSRADRAARRHNRQRTGALSQWSKAEYWQYRTTAVIHHALFKSSSGVRRGRILRIEADQRRHEKDVRQAVKIYKAWRAVQDQENAETAHKWAYAIANQGGGYYDYEHPRTGTKTSLYSHLTNEKDPITGHEAATLALSYYSADGPPNREGSCFDRWSKHYALRLSYERQMLEAEGGTVAEVEMEPGGFIGSYQIHKVNKSPATKRVVSVSVMLEERWYRGEGVTRPDGTFGKPLTLQSMNIERLGSDVYRPPTDEEREAFKAEQKATKARTKAANVGKPKLINPTTADAQRLQDELNRRTNENKKASYERHHYTWKDSDIVEPSETWPMTQAEYSERSRGSYGPCDTVYLRQGPILDRVNRDLYSQNISKRPIVCKIRRGNPASSSFHRAYRVIVLTDKPQKPLPNWTPSEETAQALQKIGATA